MRIFKIRPSKLGIKLFLKIIIAGLLCLFMYFGFTSMYARVLYNQKLEEKIDLVSGIFCALVFCIYILRQFSKLVKDIVRIEKGIHILETGDLSYAIIVRSQDEISDLADSINRMSRELDQQRRVEELLKKRNDELVTSISHDIRTPLTSVISYTDLILGKEGQRAEEERRYLEKIKEKSYLIKELTDNLFSHFVNQNTEFEMDFQLVTGNDFMVYLLGSMEEALIDRGFEVELDTDLETAFFLKADTVQIQRVFNNMEGNLIKYASKAEPIRYRAYISGQMLVIEGINAIGAQSHADSHGVGFHTCREILKRHGGIMETWLENGRFYNKISLPVVFMAEFQ